MEDNRADVFLIRESIESACPDAILHVISDGDKAIEYFEQTDRDESAPGPALVILDINLPKKPGHVVLDRMRASQRCASAPVVVVTSSNSERDRERMGQLGVSGYFRKPSEYEEFMKLGGLVKEILEKNSARGTHG